MQYPNVLHKISIQINIVLWGYVKEVNFVQKNCFDLLREMKYFSTGIGVLFKVTTIIYIDLNNP